MNSQQNRRDITFLLITSWITRALFIAVLPANARSFDAFAWESVGGLLAQGINPYHATEYLSWPPFWMQITYCLCWASYLLHLPFNLVLQVFLISVESILIVQLYKFIREITPDANARAIVLVGISLNPIAILLVCQHCNFDVLVALWVLLFVRQLIKYQRTSDASHWLAACLFLGLGILTKTVPLILVPLLASGFRHAPTILKSIGAFLVLGPVTLAMSIIYVLDPNDTVNKILGYRSVGSAPDYFGIPNLFHLASVDRFVFIHHYCFYALIVFYLAAFWNISWRQRISEKQIILISALALASIPALGPGFATQYIYWFMPLLIASWPLFENQWRKTIAIFTIIAATTYIVEYAFIPSLGCYLTYLLDPTMQPQSDPLMLPPTVQAIFHFGVSPTGLTIINLPLFIAYLMLILIGFKIILTQPCGQGSRQ